MPPLGPIPISRHDTKGDIRRKAFALGFDAVGFAPAAVLPRVSADFHAFLADGRHATMSWMEDRATLRASPRALWPAARSVVVLGLNYGPDHDPLSSLPQTERANISVYARNRDYHEVMKKKQRVLARWMAQTFGVEVKLFVDTAPVMEKPLAQQAGLGWQGKNTHLVSRTFGSWLFLGEIFTTLEITPDAPHTPHCGTCTRCLDICPTGALTAPYRMDARRCISYLTIEHKGPIPEDLRPLMGHRIYGCDDCVAVCPWNRFAQPASDPSLQATVQNTLPLLSDLVGLDDAAFRVRFSGSPVKRIGRERFIRNVLIALGNGANPASAPFIQPLQGDESAVVREAADWALKRLNQRP